MKLINYFLEFIVTESYVFARTSVNRLFKNREKDRLAGKDKLVVFIEGYGGYWPNLGISKYLSNRHFDYIFLDYKTLHVNYIDDYAKKINQKILSVGKKYKHIDLVGFSLGGVAALTYLNNYKNKVHTLITVSTPFAGSYFANFPFMESISNDLRPNSENLNKIQTRSSTNKAQIVCASPIWDQLCVFTENNSPKYANSVKLKAIGHNSAMRIGVTKHLFDKYL